VDTWIKKLYRDLFSVPGSEHGARKRLVDCFGRFSGIAQQFLFFYYREHAASIAGA
jgi:3-methyladenine DNA glycosylase/8-oxoguanine DNA glycosylase